jgi:hypothetical protein
MADIKPGIYNVTDLKVDAFGNAIGVVSINRNSGDTIPGNTVTVYY